MTYTLLQAAKLLGVTKNTIKYRYRKLPSSARITDEDGTLLVTEDGIEMLKSVPIAANKEPHEEPVKTTINHEKPRQKPVLEPQRTSSEPPEEPHGKPPENGSKDAHIASLLDTIEYLKEQLTVKDVQISDLSKKLDGQMAITAKVLSESSAKDMRIRQLEAAQIPTENGSSAEHDKQPEEQKTDQPISIGSKILRGIKGVFKHNI